MFFAFRISQKPPAYYIVARGFFYGIKIIAFFMPFCYIHIMSFYREIGNLLGLDWARIASGYSFVNYNGEAVYLEGIKRVVNVSDIEIIVDTKKARIKIAGEELAIFSLEEKTMIVKGKILNTGVVE